MGTPLPASQPNDHPNTAYIVVTQNSPSRPGSSKPLTRLFSLCLVHPSPSAPPCPQDPAQLWPCGKVPSPLQFITSALTSPQPFDLSNLAPLGWGSQSPCAGSSMRTAQCPCLTAQRVMCLPCTTHRATGRPIRGWTEPHDCLKTCLVTF